MGVVLGSILMVNFKTNLVASALCFVSFAFTTIVNAQDISIDWRVVGINPVEEEEPHYTVEVYVVIPDGHQLNSVIGDSNSPLLIQSSTNFYQNQFGGATSTSINPVLIEYFPSLAYDSWVTIGREDQVDNEMLYVGIDFTDFESGGTIWTDNGTWIASPQTSQVHSQSYLSRDCTEKNGVLIGQFTTMGLDSEIVIQANFQGKYADGSNWNVENITETIFYQGELDCNENRIA